MPKISELSLPKNLLITGVGGTGKTRLCGSLCEILPTLLVTADLAGFETLRRMGIDDTEFLYVEDWSKIAEYYGQIAEASQRYAAVALDDYGALQDTIEERITMQPSTYQDEKAVRDKGMGAFRQQALEAQLLGDRRLSTISSHGSSWNQLSSALDAFLSRILRLPFKVKLVTCLETVAMNPRTQTEHIYPALAGRARTTLTPRFSLVAEAFIASTDGKTSQFCLTCRPHPRMETKSRYDDTGRTWINPTILKVLSYMNGKGEPETKLEKETGTGL